jgi:hypothetical protein
MPLEVATGGSGGAARQSLMLTGTARPPEETDTAGCGQCRPVFYSPWFESEHRGSYFYKNGWETIDHFLFTSTLFDDRGFEFAEFQAVSLPFMVDDRGRPLKWVSGSMSGYSDHLPLLVTLRF